MFNMPPGSTIIGKKCTVHTDLVPHECPWTTLPDRHAHVNRHGVTFTCNGALVDINHA